MKNSKAYIMNKLYAGKYLLRYMEKNETLTTLERRRDRNTEKNESGRIYKLWLFLLKA